MRKLFILCLFIAFASATPFSDLASQFLVGVNTGFNNVVDQQTMNYCASEYGNMLPDLFQFTENLFIDWNLADFILNGDFFEGLNEELTDWDYDCRPVIGAYDTFFTQAMQAYQFDRKTFWSTVESNFEANKVEIISIAIDIVSEIRSGEGEQAGSNFASILKILLSNWLSQSSQTKKI